MGITLSRGMRKKSLARNFNAAYFCSKNSYLLDGNESEIGVEEEKRTSQGSLFNLQRIFVENVLESESDWKFLF